MPDDIVIRREIPGDIAAIRTVVEAAFPSPIEAWLVEQLRENNDAIFSMVAIDAGSIVGHAMLSKMSAPFPALGLAPVAVAPSHQRKGIGKRLVRAVLEEAKNGEWRAVFVLGAPRFYQCFGFELGLASGFASPYAGPHLMALALRGPLPVTTGKIDYAPAFAALG